VVAIDTTGTTSSGVVQYTVTLALDRTIADLKPGMSANASVTTGERDNVLNVPNAAVSGSGSSATVKVLQSDGTQRTANIIAGLKGDSNTEIVSGVIAGQRVVTSSGTVPTGAGGTTGTTGRTGGLPGGGGFPGGGGGFPRGG
jgi:macrolide-specific efflux system membrane fusion protein